MPTVLPPGLRQLHRDEFAQVSYEVIGQLFAIRAEFGRYFDEAIYKRELAWRMPDVELEVPVEVSFDCFRKVYALDVLAGGGAVFEIKAAEALHDRHRSQLLNYLMLCDLPSGKLVNVRSEQVEHEFVNSAVSWAERRQFAINDQEWESDERNLSEWIEGLVGDLGTGLDGSLYQDAVIAFLGGVERVEHPVEILSAGYSLGHQKFRLVSPGVAFKITTLNGELDVFESNARRLLSHTALERIQWINIARHLLTFRTLNRA